MQIPFLGGLVIYFDFLGVPWVDFYSGIDRTRAPAQKGGGGWECSLGTGRRGPLNPPKTNLTHTGGGLDGPNLFAKKIVPRKLAKHFPFFQGFFYQIFTLFPHIAPLPWSVAQHLAGKHTNPHPHFKKIYTTFSTFSFSRRNCLMQSPGMSGCPRYALIAVQKRVLVGPGGSPSVRGGRVQGGGVSWSIVGG